MTVNEGSLIFICSLLCSYVFYHIGFIKGSSWMRKVSEENRLFKDNPTTNE
jgi:hypothetical protein